MRATLKCLGYFFFGPRFGVETDGATMFVDGAEVGVCSVRELEVATIVTVTSGFDKG